MAIGDEDASRDVGRREGATDGGYSAPREPLSEGSAGRDVARRPDAPGGGIRLRPMGIGDLLDETFKVYRRHFLSFVIATALVAVPVALLSMALNLAVGQGVSQGRIDSTDDLVAFGVGAMLVGLAGGLGYLLSGAAAVRLASDAVLGRRLDVGAAYRGVVGRILALLWAGFLVSLATMLLAVTIIGIPVAIYFGIGWAVYTQAVVLEGLGGRAGMRRSGALVDGHRWRVLGVSVLMSILVSILISVPSALVAAMMGAVVAFAETPGTRALLEVVNAFMSAVGQSLFGSLAWIMTTLVYYELRVRKEAFDLEQLAARAEDPPPPPAYAG